MQRAQRQRHDFSVVVQEISEEVASSDGAFEVQGARDDFLVVESGNLGAASDDSKRIDRTMANWVVGQDATHVPEAGEIVPRWTQWTDVIRSPGVAVGIFITRGFQDRLGFAAFSAGRGRLDGPVTRSWIIHRKEMARASIRYGSAMDLW